MSESHFNSGRTDKLVGLALAAIYLAVLIASAKPLGFARDEGFYFSAARSYQAWFDLLLRDPSRALSPSEIDRYWRNNHEHPALMKTAFGFSNRLFDRTLGWLTPSTSFRLPGMLTAALCVFLIYLWASAALGPRAGWFAAIAFALLPRVFCHAHLACFDVPITFMWLLVSYCYWRSLSSWRFGILAGIAFGLSICVKLNAFFLPFVLGLHYLTLLWYCRRRKEFLLPKPWAFVFGFILAPLIFFAHWPWIWHDTFHRLLQYVGFHSTHSHYNTAWFGENIVGAPTPMALPAVMTLFTIPTVVIALFFVGTFLRLSLHLPPALERRFQNLAVRGVPPSRNGLDLLWLLAGAFSILLISLPSVPKFGGTKHWMPAFPFIAMVAGGAASRLADWAKGKLRVLPQRVVSTVAIAFLLLPPLQQTATSHPFGLASYVPLIGGAPGAATLGMTTQFWGYTTAGVLPWLNAHCPARSRVEFHDTAFQAYQMYVEEGQLRKDIAFSRLQQSDFALLQHELHMIRNEAWIWNEYDTIVPVHVLTYQGVPLISIYQRHPAGDLRRARGAL
jgi:4-amino-4-deoxy-L-arabinose transferase-like glycosyltransferase